MKKNLLLTLFFIATSVTLAQNYGLYIGPAVSYHHENRSRMIYGPGLEERSSTTQFLGTGLRMQKQFNRLFGLNMGLNYVERQYEMIVPYNHCNFEEFCTYILAHVDRYGYKTIEIPLGVNLYVVSNNKWELYFNANGVTAFDFQSIYHPYLPETEARTINEFNFFSGSLTTGLGLGYHLTEKVKISMEPFIRVIHAQRSDPILITGYEKKWTNFDNLGLHVLFLYRL
ncbi:MAG TPA: hypothetical protein VK014_02065 [Cyclobacteriaceae bacterium]|nr:hypothetical protein [Cyclobacteriaceae bacterium]